MASIYDPENLFTPLSYEMVDLGEISFDELIDIDNSDLIVPNDIQTENEILCPEVATDPWRGSPLDYAAKTGEMEVIDILLQTMHTDQLEADTVKFLVENALHVALAENQREAFRVLAYKYMEDWNSNKVASIKTTNKLLLEANVGIQDPRLLEADHIMALQELNTLLIYARNKDSTLWMANKKEDRPLMELEKLLNNNTLLFETVSSPRSCPLETQLYLTVFTKETDDLVKQIMKRKPELAEPSYYPLHDASGYGYIKTVKLILSQVSCTSTACSQKCKDKNYTPLHHAVEKFGTSEVVRELLSTSWDCVGAVTNDRRTTALCLAARLERYSIFKILLEYHIVKDELLDNSNVNYWKDGKFVLEIADRYVKIVKELLCQSDCKICFVKYKDDSGNWKGCFAAVIKGKLTDNILDVVEYVEEAKDGPLIQLSYYKMSITLKVLLRHPRIRDIMDIRDENGDSDLLNTLKKRDPRNTNLMGELSTWEYKRYHQAILLMDVIKMGDFEGYIELVSLYPDILDCVSEFPLGGTPLHISIKAGQGKLTTFIKDIIRRRPDFAYCPNRNGFTSLHVG